MEVGKEQGEAMIIIAETVFNTGGFHGVMAEADITCSGRKVFIRRVDEHCEICN